jgi:hypothetical protein
MLAYHVDLISSSDGTIAITTTIFCSNDEDALAVVREVMAGNPRAYSSANV